MFHNHTCGTTRHWHNTPQDRDRCIRGEAPCTAETHAWVTLRRDPPGRMHYEQCTNCGRIDVEVLDDF